jgi:endonuclease/exonuclease/phosphatase family metal-dependent hydrolase
VRRAGRLRTRRSRALLVAEALLVALLPAAASVGHPVPVTVLTQNLFVGTSVGPVFTASSWDELVAAGSTAWAGLQATDLPTRMGVLAGEVAQVRPDVLGLQEAFLWREQAPGDSRTHPGPDATEVVLDPVALLRQDLAARGVPYTPVATSTGVDVEFPRLDPARGLVDVRLTDHDVLLVRADLAGRTSDPRHGLYTAQFDEATASLGPAPSTRGWTSVVLRPQGAAPFRLVETHLEVAGDAGRTQERQGAELLALVEDSPLPVVVLGDLNSVAPAGPTYRRMTGALTDAWVVVRPGDPGPTCCQPGTLADPVGHQDGRIDLVLVPPGWPVTGADLVGARPFRPAPPPVWVSDHLGLTARFQVPAG